VGTYATLFLLALLTLVTFVYFPKVRKPALWITLGILGLGGLAVGGYLLYERHAERAAERTRDLEYSYLVDHAIGKPSHCKSKPFTNQYDGRFIKDHDLELNDFIGRSPADPRVPAVQTALSANGVG
jgi:hypothetical protein